MKIKNILWCLKLAHLGGKYSQSFGHVYSSQEGAEREQEYEASMFKVSFCRQTTWAPSTLSVVTSFFPS